MSILQNHHMTRMAQALCAVLLTVSASYAADVDLSTLTDSYTALNGDVLSGTLGGNYQISIADGATVTLNGVTIDGGDDVAQNDVYSWAGLTCLGDCTIKLADKSKNTVKGFYEYYPGIYVPESKTMTIEGTGSLDASSNGYGAGIGGGNRIPCGNIVIKGGSITARGSGNAAGIGSGAGAQAGNITITDGVTNVTAKPGEWAPNSVGAGNGGSVGSITIGGVVSGNVTTNPFKYPVTGTYTVVFDVNGGSGAMENQTIRLGFPQVLSKNAFTRKGYRFTGWNTEPDGSGIGYEDLAKVENLAEKDGSITLYALWFQGDIKDLKNNYTIKDGETVKGTLGGNYKISIADGATVTLDGVTINGVDNETAKWAGLTCLGECKIVLAEGSINTVKGFYLGFPGIYVPEGKTLTIEGTGSLEASSNGSGAGIGGGGNLSCGNIVIKGGEIKAEGGYGSAGIGSGRAGSAGDITISGGTVTAKGGNCAAGIGSGYEGSAGDITISGGTVTATGEAFYGAGIGSGQNAKVGDITISGGTVTAEGGNYAAGIGSGYEGSAGAITISEENTKVTAKPGESAPYSVGASDGGSVAAITIDGVVSGNVTLNPFEYPVTGTYTVTFNGNGGSGTMKEQEIRLGFPQALSANGFKRDSYRFSGWNTKADGTGVAYEDMAKVENLAEKDGSITLYAQWFNGDIGTISSDITLQNGDTVTGILNGNYQISIADGATVTLDGLTINGVNDEAYKWAGLTCLGDCTIKLADKSKNTVKGFYWYYPGIYVPEGKTLTIEGTGSLDASSNGYGAGIGGVYELSSGNIVIKGGTVTATGGNYAAGIGSGYGGTAGAITITDGVTKVTATAGSGAPNSVGAGYGGSVDKVTVAGVETGSINVNTFEFEPSIINYIVDKDNNVIASINGYDDHTKEFPDIGDTTVAGVIFNRNLATAGYSTIVLPFKVKTENLTGVKSVSTFGGVEPGKVTQKAVRMDVVWKDDGRENVELDAYTPYLIETDGSFKVSGGVTIKSIENQKDTTTVDNWSFVGARSFKKWEDGDSELGHAYGFAASSSGDVKAGDFVKIGAGAYIYPMRAYLVKEQTAASVRGTGYNMLRSSAEELPERMSVIIVDKKKDGEPETTTIGTFNTRTGEFKFTMPKRTYDLKGRNVGEGMKARGAYYGKKVLAK